MRRVLVPLLLLTAAVAGAVELCSNVDGIFHEIRCNAAYSTMIFDNTTLVLDCTNNRVGVGTSSPSEALHVVGNIKASGIFYGSGVGLTGIVSTGTVDAHTMSYSTHGATDQATASRMMVRDASGGVAVAALTASSLTVTGLAGASSGSITNSFLTGGQFGALGSFTTYSSATIAAGTMTVAGGIVNAPTQPRFETNFAASLSITDNKFTAFVFSTLQYHSGNLYNTATGTTTIPTGGAGLYDVQCSGAFPAQAAGARIVRIVKNNTTVVAYNRVVSNSASYATHMQTVDIVNLSEGDTVRCEYWEDSGAGTLTMDGYPYTKMVVSKRL